MFKKNRKFKKLDVLIIVITVIVSFTMFFAFSNQSGNIVEIFVSGNLYGKYPLYDNNEVIIDTKKGILTFCIDNGKVFVVDSDCADGKCKKQGIISGKGKSIICLPLETVIKIGEDNYEFAY